MLVPRLQRIPLPVSSPFSYDETSKPLQLATLESITGRQRTKLLLKRFPDVAVVAVVSTPDGIFYINRIQKNDTEGFSWWKTLFSSANVDLSTNDEACSSSSNLAVLAVANLIVLLGCNRQKVYKHFLWALYQMDA